jgi:hypothetical protein
MKSINIMAWAVVCHPTCHANTDWGIWEPDTSQNFGLVMRELDVTRPELQKLNPGLNIDSKRPGVPCTVPYRQPLRSGRWLEGATPTLLIEDAPTAVSTEDKQIKVRMAPSPDASNDNAYTSLESNTAIAAMMLVLPETSGHELSEKVTDSPASLPTGSATASPWIVSSAGTKTALTPSPSTGSSLATDMAALAHQVPSVECLYSDNPGYSDESFGHLVKKATEELCILPPVEKMRAGDKKVQVYWDDGESGSHFLYISWIPNCKGEEQSLNHPLGRDGPRCADVLYGSVWAYCEY